MKLKDLNITGLEVAMGIAFSVVDDKGGLYMIPDSDVSSVSSGTPTEIVTNITRVGDTIQWGNITISLDQEIG